MDLLGYYYLPKLPKLPRNTGTTMKYRKGPGIIVGKGLMNGRTDAHTND